MSRALLAVAVILACAPISNAHAQLWNKSSGPVVYEGSVRGQFTTEVVHLLALAPVTIWTYTDPQSSGIWDEGFSVYWNESGDVCFRDMGCNWTSDFSESFGGTVNNLFGDPVLVPAQPYIGQTWDWLDTLDLYRFSVVAQEQVETGEGALMAWRIDLSVAQYDSFSLCTDTLLPFSTTSFWVSEGYGIIKWTTPAEEFVLVSADSVVPIATDSMSALKHRFGQH